MSRSRLMLAAIAAVSALAVPAALAAPGAVPRITQPGRRLTAFRTRTRGCRCARASPICCRA